MNWSAVELQRRAEYLISAGHTAFSVELLLSGQVVRIGLLRCGTVIRRLDGPSWRVIGNRGQALDTTTDLIEIRQVDVNGETAHARDSKIYGRVDLKEHLFRIVDAPG